MQKLALLPLHRGSIKMKNLSPVKVLKTWETARKLLYNTRFSEKVN